MLPAIWHIRKPNAIASGDFDCDGTIDLAIGLAVEPRGVLILFGAGAGGFDRSTFTPLPGDSVTGLPVGDGHLDALAASYGDGSVTIFRGNGDGTFSLVNTLEAAGGARSVFVGDLDEDQGSKDLAVACQSANAVVVLRYLSGFQYAPLAPEHVLAVNGRPRVVDGADLDLDGDRDLVVACYAGGSMDYLENAGDATFRPARSIPLGIGVDSLVVVDLDRDGVPDVALCLFGEDSVEILLNTWCMP